MKYSYTYKTISIALSFLVLFSTLSLAIEKHFCGDVLVDVAVFSEVGKCAKDIVENNSADTLKTSCCKNEIDVLEGLSTTTVNSLEDIEISDKQLLFVYCFTSLSSIEYLPKLVIPHKNYSPPILVEDLQVFNETYLI